MWDALQAYVGFTARHACIEVCRVGHRKPSNGSASLFMILTKTPSLGGRLCHGGRTAKPSAFPDQHPYTKWESLAGCVLVFQRDHTSSGARRPAARCHAHVRAEMVDRLQRHKLTSQTFKDGLCGLPGVTSPGLLQSYYSQAVAPRLQRLHAAVQRSSPSAVMTELLDQLWCDLKTILSTSRHISSR